MKNFEKPFYDGETDWGAGGNCSGDTPTCTCTVNYNPAIANCIPCGAYSS